MAGRHKKHEEHEEHVDEAWLVSYADMMTLLVALFMVLFSISSVNVSKFESLQRSMKEAFSGKVFPGGEALKDNGGSNTDMRVVAPPLSATVSPQIGGESDTPGEKRGGNSSKAKAEQQGFEDLKKRLDEIARKKGLSGRVRTRITSDGLQIRILTDELLFDSGSAVLKPAGLPLLQDAGRLLAAEGRHPVTVSGHTDSEPISTRQFPSNWELSTARATAVLHAVQKAGVAGKRMTAAGRAQLDPIADNDSPAGRVLNRRVEILIPRLEPTS